MSFIVLSASGASIPNKVHIVKNAKFKITAESILRLGVNCFYVYKI